MGLTSMDNMPYYESEVLHNMTCGVMDMMKKLQKGFIWMKKSKARILGASLIALVMVVGGLYLMASAFGGNAEESKEEEPKAETNNDEREDSSSAGGQSGDASDPEEDVEKEEEESDENEEIVEESPPDEGAQQESDAKGEDPQRQGTSGSTVDIRGNNNSGARPDTETHGIDVSKWQGVIDWKQVKEAGVDFAMIRVGYRTLDTGVIVEDPYAKYNLQQATARGIKVGAYFFSTSVTEKEALEEARWVANFLRPYPITYPVAHNTEHFDETGSRQYNMSKNERSRLAMVFLDEVKGQGYTPMFYASQSEMENNHRWNATELSRRHKIWVAQYPGKPYPDTEKSAYSGAHEMWQYTSQGRVPGISGPVDLNVAYFGFDQSAEAQEDAPQEEATADPGAKYRFDTVDETVTAKMKANLRTEPSSNRSDTIVGSLKNGDSLKRIGIGDNGWSRLKYNGKNVYAVTNLLTTDLTYGKEENKEEKSPPEDFGMTFKEENKEVTAKERVNLRSKPNTEDGKVVESLSFGDVAKLTGISNSGWARLEYGGNTLYAVYSFLTEDMNYQENQKPEEPEPPKEPVEPEEESMVFKDRNEKVTAKDLTNLRSEPATDGGNDTVVTSLKHGEEAVRTGISDHGWSRLEYDGKTLYAVSNFLEKID